MTVFKQLLNDYKQCLLRGDHSDGAAAYLALVDEYEQAARRAPAAPVPQGWKLAIGLCELVECENAGDSDFERGMRTAAKRIRKELGAAAPQPPEGFMSEIRTTKPEAAPVQMPEPDSYKHMLDTTEGIPGNQPRVKRTERSANPFGVPEIDYDKSFPYSIEKLYTEQQVRQLLADNGIGKDKA